MLDDDDRRKNGIEDGVSRLEDDDFGLAGGPALGASEAFEVDSAVALDWAVEKLARESWLGRSTKNGDEPGRSTVDQGVVGLAASSSAIFGNDSAGLLDRGETRGGEGSGCELRFECDLDGGRGWLAEVEVEEVDPLLEEGSLMCSALEKLHFLPAALPVDDFGLVDGGASAAFCDGGVICLDDDD